MKDPTAGLALGNRSRRPPRIRFTRSLSLYDLILLTIALLSLLLLPNS